MYDTQPDRAADRAKVAAWATDVLSDERTVILDSETTGLTDAYAVELSVTDRAGTELFDRRLNPRVAISSGASQIHGITNEDVAQAATFAEVMEELTACLKGRRVIIYNAQYDLGILRNELHRYYTTTKPDHVGNGEHPYVNQWRNDVSAEFECAMQRYAAWVGDWSSWHGSYTWPALKGGDHSALGDCRAVVATLQTMAASA